MPLSRNRFVSDEQLQGAIDTLERETTRGDTSDDRIRAASILLSYGLEVVDDAGNAEPS